MNTHRITAWTTDPKDGAQVLSADARRFVGLPCRLHTYTLRHVNALGCEELAEVSIFPQGVNQPQAVAFIAPTAPRWVEPALRGLFDEHGGQVYGSQIDLREGDAKRTETHASSHTAAPVTA